MIDISKLPHRQNKNGYWYTKCNGMWVITGRLVLADKLGRELLPTERVKYKDGNRDNNHPDNLEINTDKAWSSVPLLKTRLLRLTDRLNKLTVQFSELESNIENTSRQIEELKALIQEEEL